MTEKPQRLSSLPPGKIQREKDPLISLVVPVFNEESTLNLFITSVSEVLDKHKLRVEFVFVNDGSSDGTLRNLLIYSTSDARIKVINLSRNFGKEAALTAGLDYAVGDVFIPIDVDLQDPPDLIPRFVERWREGYDVVYGLRTNRESESLVKRTTAIIFYRIFKRLSHIDMPENVGDFRLIDRRVVEVLRKLPEKNRFMKGLFSWVGFRSIGVPYVRPVRAAGMSKWNYWKLWNFALDGIIGFSSTPIRVWSYMGATIALISFLYAIYIVSIVVFRGVDVPGYASLLTVILFMGGVQLLSLGVIGEYIGRLFVEVKGRPVYIVDQVFPPSMHKETKL